MPPPTKRVDKSPGSAGSTETDFSNRYPIEYPHRTSTKMGSRDRHAVVTNVDAKIERFRSARLIVGVFINDKDSRFWKHFTRHDPRDEGDMSLKM